MRRANAMRIAMRFFSASDMAGFAAGAGAGAAAGFGAGLGAAPRPEALEAARSSSNLRRAAWRSAFLRSRRMSRWRRRCSARRFMASSPTELMVFSRACTRVGGR